MDPRLTPRESLHHHARCHRSGWHDHECPVLCRHNKVGKISSPWERALDRRQSLGLMSGSRGPDNAGPRRACDPVSVSIVVSSDQRPAAVHVRVVLSATNHYVATSVLSGFSGDGWPQGLVVRGPLEGRSNGDRAGRPRWQVAGQIQTNDDGTLM